MRASNTSILWDQGKSAETHSWAVLEMWFNISHTSFKISVQDVARTLIEMDLLFLFFKTPKTCSNKPQIKISNGYFLKPFFHFGMPVTNKLQ